MKIHLNDSLSGTLDTNESSFRVGVYVGRASTR